MFQEQNGLPYALVTSGTAPNAVSSGGGINGSNGRKGIDLVGRNTFRMPRTQVMDLRFSKKITTKERYSLELMAEAFNLFNHFNVTAMSSVAQQSTGYLISTSGSITDTTGATKNCSSSAPCLSYNTPFGSYYTANSNFVYGTRQIQLGLRLLF